jgi:integrase
LIERSNGSLNRVSQVRVLPGAPPERYLTRTIHASKRKAEDVLSQMLVEAGLGSHVVTDGTLHELARRWWTMAEPNLSPTTAREYRRLVWKVIVPRLGEWKVRALRTSDIDQIYGELSRRLSAQSVHHVHAVLRRLLNQGVRWGWLSTNPALNASPPKARRKPITPPRPEQVSRLIAEAERREPDLGCFLRLAAVTGARRGELCALRWTDIDLENAVVSLRRSLAQVGGKCWEKDTKSHQQRRVALDEETVSILRAYRKRWQEHALALGTRLRPNAFVFSRSPDASTHLRPDSVTQRYGRTATRLGIETTLHKLRHYSATELISAGVDIRTVAGRLGHGGGGLTTLRVFRLGSRIRPGRRRLTCRQATPTPLAKRTPGPAAPEPPGHG